MKFHRKPLDLFWYWINERHLIYLKSKVHKQPWPWTEDPILREYKFTNPLRENDTGTVWLRENWRNKEPFATHPSLFFNICLYRQFNWIPTAEFLGFQVSAEDLADYSRDVWANNIWPWNAGEVESDLRARRDEDKCQIFTGAYMITGSYAGKAGKDKIWQMVWVLDNIWKNQEKYKPQPGDSLEDAFCRLNGAPGFGPFVTYEVITDLRYTHYLENASDIMDWANPGPGAMRGLNRLWGLPLDKKQNTKTYIEGMQALLDAAPDALGDHLPREQFDMRMIEHSLCEVDKYMRVMNGEGRPRSRYTPSAQV